MLTELGKLDINRLNLVEYESVIRICVKRGHRWDRGEGFFLSRSGIRWKTVGTESNVAMGEWYLVDRYV